MRRLLMAGGVAAMLGLGHVAGAQISATGPSATGSGGDTSATVLSIVGQSGETLDVTAAMLGQLPAARVTESAEDGGGVTSYEGPLLWAVLDRAGALSPAVREQAAQAVLVSGTEGFTSLLALAEISPAFEGKQVILAEREDGRALPVGQVELVIPGDHRAGRFLSDVTRIAVVSP